MNHLKRVLRHSLFAATGLAMAVSLLPAQVLAADAVRIGVVLPLSGVAAGQGVHQKLAIETAVDIINNDHPELGELTLAQGQGLPGLNGAKVEVIFADAQGNPAESQNQAVRLITQQNVTALLGASLSGLTATASAAAERYGVPFLNPDSTAPILTERGFKWFFRTTPMAADVAQLYVDFLKDMQSKGINTEKISLVYENSEYGTAQSKMIAEKAEEAGLSIGQKIVYSANSTDVQPQVLQMKDYQPDVAIFMSYTSDAILFVKTMHALGYKPPVLIGDDSGFSDPNLISTAGSLAQGVLNRSAFDIGKPGSVTYKVNELYKQRTGEALDDTSARGMQGFFVLLDAINRAGSTEPEKIRQALVATDLKKEQLMVSYSGVKFDEKGQNELASTLMIQLHGDSYVGVWPTSSASSELELPYKGWEQ